MLHNRQMLVNMCGQRGKGKDRVQRIETKPKQSSSFPYPSLFLTDHTSAYRNFLECKQFAAVSLHSLQKAQLGIQLVKRLDLPRVDLRCLSPVYFTSDKVATSRPSLS